MNQFELLSFTESIENFRQFCGKIVATGGNDAPEDVFGGLEKAITTVNWAEDSMCTKIIFHIADAPCHGQMYHSLCDSYPNGDPLGRTAESLFNSLRQKGIQYHFAKITADTAKMIQMFSEAMGSEILVFDVHAVNTIVDNVVSSVSIGTSLHPAMRAKPHILTIEKAVPDWSKLPTFTGSFLTYDMPESIYDIISGVPLKQKNPTKAKVHSNSVYSRQTQLASNLALA